MSKYSNSDRYIDPQTGILKNRLGITTEDELEKAEASFATARSYELSKNHLEGNFDLEHFKAIHRYLFKDLYEWAGECRDIDISKGDNFFAHFPHIEAASKTVFSSLAREKHLANLSKPNFSDRAAHYLGEMNALHPFREGNGRAQREFISHLAYKNSYRIDWNNISQQEMIQASVESFKGDCSKFAAYIRANIHDLNDGTEKPAIEKNRKPQFPKP